MMELTEHFECGIRNNNKCLAERSHEKPGTASHAQFNTALA